MQRDESRKELLKGVFELYKDFVSKLPDGYARQICQGQLERLANNPIEKLEKITITLPLSHIKKIYESHYILILRDPTQDKLLFGCGNGEKGETALMPVNYHTSDEAKHEHDHSDYDTLNCMIDMNPTIIADLATQGRQIKEALEGTFEHQYHTIATEAASLINPTPAELEESFCFMPEDCVYERVAGKKVSEHSSLDEAGFILRPQPTKTALPQRPPISNGLPAYPPDPAYSVLYRELITHKAMPRFLQIADYELQDAGFEQRDIVRLLETVKSNSLGDIVEMISNKDGVIATLPEDKKALGVHFLQQAYNILDAANENEKKFENPLPSKRF